MKKLLIPFLVCLGLVLLVACSSGDDASSGDSITGVEWQWQSLTNQSTNETTDVPNPSDYTITLNEDGTFEGKADCNNIAGSWTDESGFSITVGPSTMAFCGEASLDTQYVNLLGNVAAGGPDGSGGLALETAGGAERMLFAE